MRSVMPRESSEKSQYYIVIEQKFLEGGHTYMEVDNMHSAIEKAEKYAPVYTMHVWLTIFRMAQTCRSKKNPYNVEELKFSDFLDFEKLSQHFLVYLCSTVITSSHAVKFTGNLRKMFTTQLCPKVRPLFEKLNERFMGFASISQNRSVDKTCTVELYEQIFDNDVINLLVDASNCYASLKNRRPGPI
nr:unnamed protein product [Callosobruchus analis]